MANGYLSDTETATGRSGRRYGVTPLAGHAPVEGQEALYALRLHNVWSWVGSASDLIESPDSRTRFRDLCRAGAKLYRLDASADPLERMTIAWDLEGARAGSHRSAA